MLDQILRHAVPLKGYVDLPDPWGWGFLWRIFRMDATDFEEAERDLGPYREFIKSLQKTSRVALAKAQGSRRGKGGVLIVQPDKESEEDLSIPVIKLDDRLEIIAEHLGHPIEWPDDVADVWPGGTAAMATAAEDNPGRAAARWFLGNVPLDENGSPRFWPAALRDGEPVLQVSDIDIETDEEFPYAGFGATCEGQGYEPTLNRILAAWIYDQSKDADNFSKPGEIEDGIEAIRPTNGGKGSSSEPEAPRTDAR